MISIPSDQSRTKNLAGKELATDADTKQAANSRLEKLHTYSFHAGKQVLVPRWDKSVMTTWKSDVYHVLPMCYVGL